MDEQRPVDSVRPWKECIECVDEETGEPCGTVYRDGPSYEADNGALTSDVIEKSCPTCAAHFRGVDEAVRPWRIAVQSAVRHSEGYNIGAAVKRPFMADDKDQECARNYQQVIAALRALLDTKEDTNGK
jgi:hypothetical protein